jgi:Flp pilus assembly protein TadD
MRVYSNLGFLYTELRQYDKARAALEKATQLSKGKDPVVYANLGVLYEDLGEWQQARQAYQKAVALSPTNDVFALKLKTVEKKLETADSQGNKIAQ